MFCLRAYSKQNRTQIEPVNRYFPHKQLLLVIYCTSLVRLVIHYVLSKISNILRPYYSIKTYKSQGKKKIYDGPYVKRPKITLLRAIKIVKTEYPINGRI